MRNMRTRGIAWLLTVLILVGGLPTGVSPESASEAGDSVVDYSDAVQLPWGKTGREALHTVTFTVDGETISVQSVAEGSHVETLPDAPEKTGKIFLGWYDGNARFGTDTAVTADLEVRGLYAETDEELEAKKRAADFVWRDEGQYAAVTVFGTHRKNQAPTAGRDEGVGGGLQVLEAWTAGNIKNRTELTAEAFVTALPAGGSLSAYTVTGGKTGTLLASGLSIGDRVTAALSAKGANGIAFVLEPEEESAGDDAAEIEGALYANEDLYITGKIPGNGIVEVTPVRASIAGEELLCAYDISVYANRKQQEKGNAWQPADRKVRVHFRNDAFKGRLNVYHFTGGEAEYIDTVTASDGWIEFDAAGFSVYAFTSSIEKTVTIGGATYKITVVYDASARIPDGAELEVTELSPDAYLDQTAAALGWGTEDEVFYTKFLDIGIVKDGVEIEPKSEVEVIVELLDVQEGAEALEVVHFGAAGAEKIECEVSGNGTVTFITDSFSAFGFGSVLRSLLSWTGDAVTYTLQGFSSLLQPTYTAIEVALEEGLEVLNAYRVESRLGSLLGSLYVRVSTALNLGSRESVVVYSINDGKVGSVLTEGENVDESVALSGADGFAVVKDTGYRRKNFDLGEVGLSGMMPKDAEASAEDVADTVTVWNETVLAAYDISITENGAEYQPDPGHPVHVEIAAGELAEDAELALYHVRDDGTMEAVENFTVSGGRVSFDASGFSVYVLTDQTCRRTYRFFVLNADGKYVEYALHTDAGTTVFTQIIKNGESLVVPQLPANPGNTSSTFAGWYAGTGSISPQPIEPSAVTLESDPYDFSSIPPITENDEEVHLFARFTDYAYVIFHDQYNGSSHSFPVALTRRGEMANGTAAVQISDFQVAYDDDSGENSAPGMAFYGWSYTPITTPGSSVDDNNSPVSRIETDTIQISSNVNLYPIFTPINWLNYYSGPTGSGATYIPSAYYYSGEGPASLSVPMRSGYSFDGWYTGSVDGSDNVTYSQRVSDANGNLVTMNDAANGVSVSGGRLQLTKNATIYAKWVESGVNYTIVVWRQKSTDTPDMADSAKSYDYAESFVRTATTGVSVSVDNTYRNYSGQGEYAGFTYSRCDGSKTVEGDGSTVLNVYYDRNVHTLTFIPFSYKYRQTVYSDVNLGSAVTSNTLINTLNGNSGGQTRTISGFRLRYYSNTYYIRIQNNWYPMTENGSYVWNASELYIDYLTITGLFGSSVVNNFLEDGMIGSSYPGYSWNATDTTVYQYALATIDSMPDADVTFCGSSRGTDKTIYYYVEVGNASESDGTTFNGKYYKEYKTVKHNYSYITFDEEYHPIEGYTRDYSHASPAFVYSSARGGYAADIGTNNVNRLYYDRETYTVSFLDSYTNTFVYVGGTQTGNKLNETDVKFSEAISNYVPADPTPVQIAGNTVTMRQGYSFTGWYTDPACSTRAFFENNAEYQNYTGAKVLYETMPAYNLLFYAGWETIWYKIIIDPNYGSLEGSGTTWFWEPYNGDPIEEYTWVKRDYTESGSGTYFYHYDDRSAHGWGEEWTSAEDNDRQRDAYYTTNQGDATDQSRTFKYAKNAYRYAGWYEINKETGEETLYHFGDPVTHDTYLILHWKKIGTYRIKYNATVAQNGETVTGTIDGGDSNETLFLELDGDHYADNAEAVVSRTVIPQEGYNFVGWKIRGDESGKVYLPGESFVFLSRYAVTMPEGETLFLDAVYSRVPTASIIYDANGGTIDPDALDYGGPVGDLPVLTPETSYNQSEQTAVIEKLVNNSEVRLSSGEGFSMGNAILAGWSESSAFDPDTDTLYAPGKDDGTGSIPTYYVDSEEPVRLYAVWEMKVYFHLNESTANANFGGTWDSDIYTPEAPDLYSRTVYINNPVDYPPADPVFYNPNNPENLFFHYWGTMRYAGDDITEYDFSQPVTDELHLYAYWAGPIKVPVHAVDASAEELADMDNPWLTTQPETLIEIAGTEVPLSAQSDAAVYAANVPDGYTYAFAAVKNRTADPQTLSEDDAVSALYYNSTEKKVYIRYRDTGRADAPLADTDEVYLVYYKDPLTLNISYKVMSTTGTLDNAVMSNSGYPVTASAGTYIMDSGVSRPLYWASQDTYRHFAYAVGEQNASNASGLQLITDSSDSDSSKPPLRIRNTWRGYQYSTDGGATWFSCGYDGDIQLYVVYFETDSKPTVVTVREKTIGTAEDMNEEFEYTVVITSRETTTVSQERRSRTRWTQYSGWGSWGNYSSYGTPTTTGPVTSTSESTFCLSDGGQKTETIFYSTVTTRDEGDPVTSGNTQYQYRTTTRITTEQTIEIVQIPKNTFDTRNDATDGTSTQPYTWTYTATDNGASPAVVYTNTHTPLNVEVHVALIGGGGITLDDDERINDPSVYTLTLNIDRPADSENTKVFLDEIPAATLFTGDSTVYGFAGIAYGTGGDAQGDEITAAGMNPGSIAYARMYPGDADRENIYEPILYDGSGERIETLGSYQIYYLYYPLPKVQYVKETSGGALTQVVADGLNPLNSGNTVTLNGVTVTQNQLLSVDANTFTITQSASGTGFFNMPLVLDDTTVSPVIAAYLRYVKLGAGGAGATNTSDLDAVTDSRLMYLKVDGGQVKWSLDNTSWSPFTGTPTIYAVYNETGYDLRLTKTAAGEPAGAYGIFTVRIVSNAITKSSYAVTGTGYPTVSATPAGASAPGSITLSVTNGSDITIEGLGHGEYTVTEENNDEYILTATVDQSAVSVTDNHNINGLLLNGNRTVGLTNSRKHTVTYKNYWNGTDFSGSRLHDFGNGVTYTTNPETMIGNQIFTPEAPSGYQFRGWSDTEDGAINQNAQWTPVSGLKPDGSSNKELYAVYEKLLPIQAMTYTDGDWPNGVLVSGSGETYPGGNNASPVSIADVLRYWYENRNAAVRSLLQTHFYGLAAIGDTVIQAVKYDMDHARWQYTADGSTWLNVGDETVTLYYYPNPVTVPVYWMFESEDGSLTLIDRAGYAELQGKPDEISVYNTWSYQVSRTEGGSTLYMPEYITDSTNQERCDLLYFGYGPGNNPAEESGGLTLGNTAFWLRNTAEGLKRGSDQNMTGAVVQNDLGIYVIYRKPGVTLTLTKNVTGGIGETNRDFTFTLTVSGAAAGEQYAFTKTDAGGNAASGVIASGGTFTLKSAETIAITLPWGRTAVLTEDDGAHGVYRRTWSGGGTVSTLTYPNDTLTLSNLTADAEITLENNLKAVAPTGYRVTVEPYILMLLFGVVLLLRKRRGGGADA